MPSSKDTRRPSAEAASGAACHTAPKENAQCCDTGSVSGKKKAAAKQDAAPPEGSIPCAASLPAEQTVSPLAQRGFRRAWGRFWQSPWPVILLVLVGAVARLWQLGAVPGGFNRDEAFSGYEAWALLTEGIDSMGYPWPVYFTSWGSGMNALASYLMIPFMRILGNTSLALRLPQALLGTLSLPVFYLLAKRLLNRRTALIALALLVISPWHIAMCRWSLESNMVPHFLLFALYFLVRGLEKPAYYLPAAALFGLLLYTYALMWLFVPLLLLLWGIYLLRRHQLRCSGWVLGSVVLLGVLALPLILFNLINFGLMPEIRTAYFSIPKMLVMRSSEISPLNVFSGTMWKDLFTSLVLQRDAQPTNTLGWYGIYYIFSVPFIAAGLGLLVYRCYKAARAKCFSWYALIGLWLVAGMLMAVCINNANINKLNCLHAALILCCAICFERIARFDMPLLNATLTALYAVSFVLFLHYYFTDYSALISYKGWTGIEQAVPYAMEQAPDDDVIYVAGEIPYPLLMFCSGESPSDYQDTVQYFEYPAAFLDVESFGSFQCNIDYASLGSHVYLYNSAHDWTFEEAGYTVVCFGRCSVAVPPKT